VNARWLIVLPLTFFPSGLVRAQTEGTREPPAPAIEEALQVTETKLLASDGAWFDYFGYSVSISSDTAVVGAIMDDDNGTDSGSAYVLMRSGGVWTQQVKLLAS